MENKPIVPQELYSSAKSFTTTHYNREKWVKHEEHQFERENSNDCWKITKVQFHPDWIEQEEGWRGKSERNSWLQNSSTERSSCKLQPQKTVTYGHRCLAVVEDTSCQTPLLNPNAYTLLDSSSRTPVLNHASTSRSSSSGRKRSQWRSEFSKKTSTRTARSVTLILGEGVL